MGKSKYAFNFSTELNGVWICFSLTGLHSLFYFYFPKICIFHCRCNCSTTSKAVSSKTKERALLQQLFSGCSFAVLYLKCMHALLGYLQSSTNSMTFEVERNCCPIPSCKLPGCNRAKFSCYTNTPWLCYVSPESCDLHVGCNVDHCVPTDAGVF